MRTKRFDVIQNVLVGAGLSLLAPAARAGTMTAELDRTEGALGESFLLTLTIEGSRDSDLDVPSVTGLVLRQQGVSQSTTITNGQMVSELHVTYGIYPQKAGDFTLPSFAMELDGKKEATLPLRLRVVPMGGQSPGNQAQNPAAPQGPGPQGQGQGQAPQGSGSAAGKNQDTGGVFIERECANVAPLVGQQVMCTMRVYHRGNLNGGQRLNQSSADFRRFNVEGEKRYQKVVSGQRYAVIELREIVVPLRPGKLELPAYALDARVLTWNRRSNPFNKFFDNFGGGVFNFDMNFTEEKQVTIKSETQILDVHPLPDEGKPQNFAGLVGDFHLNAAASKAKVLTGETVTITITVSGEGILDQVDQLPLNLEKYGRVYPDKPEYNEQIEGENGIRSTKTFKYALVPSAAGQFDLGSVDLPVFNPKINQYVTLQAKLGPLIVEPGKAEEKPLVVGSQGPLAPGREDVKELGQDLVGPHDGAQLLADQQFGRTDLIALTGAGGGSLLLSFGLLGLDGLRRRRRAADPSLARRSAAFRTYRGQIAQAASTGGPAGVTLAHKAFRNYVGDKFGLKGGALTSGEILARLGTLALPPESLAQAQRLIGQMEAAEFGGSDAGTDAGQLAQSLDALIGEVEKRC